MRIAYNSVELENNVITIIGLRYSIIIVPSGRDRVHFYTAKSRKLCFRHVNGINFTSATQQFFLTSAYVSYGRNLQTFYECDLFFNNLTSLINNLHNSPFYLFCFL